VTELGGLLVALALVVTLIVWLCQPHEQRWTQDGGRVTRLVTGWKWKGRPPRSFTALKLAFWAYVVTVLLGIGSIAVWAPQTPDAAHPAPFRTRGGQVYYVPRWVSRAIDVAVPVGGFFLLGLAVVGWQNRYLLKRYDHGAG
jgi:hypothetical protein